MSDSLDKLATSLISNGPHKIEVSPRRVRVTYNKQYIADTTKAQYVWEHPYFPQYYLPMDLLDKFISSHTHVDDGVDRGTLHVDGKSSDRVLLFSKGPLAGLVRLDPGAMDAWFEEDQEIFSHPKNPYHRVDTVPSSRNVKVEIDGTAVAESSNNVFLFETKLPARYYLPKTAVRMDLLRPSETVTKCPYKGEAHYYNVTVNGKEYKDVIWGYKFPILESIAVAGTLCFYNEKVDIWIDGVKEERPKTVFG